MTCRHCGWPIPADTESDCPHCGGSIDNRPQDAILPHNFRNAMRDLADRVASIEPPPELEGALLAEFDSVQQFRSRRSRTRWVAAFGTALAASVLAGALLVRPGPAPQTAGAQPPKDSEPAAFLPIPFTQPIQPYERVTVVQSDVPVSALIAAGFQVRAFDPGASIQADILISQDGRPRAIRPISFNRRIQ